eukprot:366436-Chlamydomonas_euryale.AAC.8
MHHLDQGCNKISSRRPAHNQHPLLKTSCTMRCPSARRPVHQASVFQPSPGMCTSVLQGTVEEGPANHGTVRCRQGVDWLRHLVRHGGGT